MLRELPRVTLSPIVKLAPHLAKALKLTVDPRQVKATIESGVLTLAPKFPGACKDNEFPALERPRIDTDDPILVKLKRDILCPACPVCLKEMEEPNKQTSITERVQHDPIPIALVTDKPEPNRTIDLIDKFVAKPVLLRTLHLITPNRVCARRDTEDPIQRLFIVDKPWDIILRPGAHPETEIELEERITVRTDKELPSPKKLQQEPRVLAINEPLIEIDELRKQYVKADTFFERVTVLRIEMLLPNAL
jgi:hypothetical protein